MFILPHGTWKDNIRSVILDWRQRPAGHSSEGRVPVVTQMKARSSGHSNERERSAGLSSEGRDSLITQADLSTPHVYSPAVALLHKKGPRYRRKICANSLWLYPYYTQSSPSKNKNINYIFIYLQVFHCLSSSSIYVTQCVWKIILNRWIIL